MSRECATRPGLSEFPTWSSSSYSSIQQPSVSTQSSNITTWSWHTLYFSPQPCWTVGPRTGRWRPAGFPGRWGWATLSEDTWVSSSWGWWRRQAFLILEKLHLYWCCVLILSPLKEGNTSGHVGESINPGRNIPVKEDFLAMQRQVFD